MGSKNNGLESPCIITPVAAQQTQRSAYLGPYSCPRKLHNQFDDVDCRGMSAPSKQYTAVSIECLILGWPEFRIPLWSC